MIDSLTTLIWFLVAICILVAIHEFGHFYVARRCGVKVLRFSIGFGKCIFTRKDKYGTEFAISALPLGGYVKMLDEREGDVAEEDKPFSYNSKTVGQRIAIAAAGPLANFILAFALYWFSLFILGTEQLSPVIGKVEPGSIAHSAQLVEGQELVAIDGEPTPTRRAVALHLLSRLGESGEISFTAKYPDSDFKFDSTVMLDSWLRGVEAPDPIEGLGITFYFPPQPKNIDQVLEDSAAEKAGFKKGDVLLSADGERIESWRFWVDYVRARPGVEIVVEVDRAGESVFLNLTPDSITDQNGNASGRAGVSIVPRSYPEEMIRRENYGPFGAIVEATEETWETAVFVLVSMRKLIFGEISTKNLSGPIGIAKVAASHAEHGFWAFLAFLAHLSIVLGVMNLLPIPMLDGGHILYCMVEWIKGSPVSEDIQLWGLKIGMFMIFGVMIIAFYNDILRL